MKRKVIAGIILVRKDLFHVVGTEILLNHGHIWFSADCPFLGVARFLHLKQFCKKFVQGSVKRVEYSRGKDGNLILP